MRTAAVSAACRGKQVSHVLRVLDFIVGDVMKQSLRLGAAGSRRPLARDIVRAQVEGSRSVNEVRARARNGLKEATISHSGQIQSLPYSAIKQLSELCFCAGIGESVSWLGWTECSTARRIYIRRDITSFECIS
jgi:hypothetical protein